MLYIYKYFTLYISICKIYVIYKIYKHIYNIYKFIFRERERKREREIVKQLAHMIVAVGKSKICNAIPRQNIFFLGGAQSFYSLMDYN